MSSRLFQQKSGTVTSAGVCTITFDPAPLGFINTGTVTVTDGPSGTNWSVQTSNQTIATMLGNNSCMDVQASYPDAISLVATGLTPGNTYHATWYGTCDEEGTVPLVAPDSPASSVNISGGNVVINGGTVNVSSAVATFPNQATQVLVNRLASSVGSSIINISGGIIDCHLFSSLEFTLLTGDGFNPGYPVFITLQWLDDSGNVLVNENWGMTPGTPTSLAQFTVNDVVPVRGTHCKFLAQQLPTGQPGNTAVTLTVLGSSLGGQIERPSASLVLSQQNFLLAASAQNTYYNFGTFTPGDYDFFMYGNSAGVSLLVDIWNPSSQAWDIMFFASTTASNFAVERRLALPRNTTRYRVLNLNTGGVSGCYFTLRSVQY